MKALVIIPTYNERRTIEEMIREVLGFGFDVLVIDDNSPDGTAERIKQLAFENPHIHLLQRPRKLGLGSAYREGFRFALAHDYEAIFEMDGDGSHRPHYLPRLLEALESSDIVIGSRYVKGVSVIDWPMGRLLLSYLANVFSRLMTGLPIHDMTAGFKCFRRSALEALEIEAVHSEGYSFQIEVNFILYRKGFRFREIPIIFEDRNVGVSKMSRWIIFEALWIVLKLSWIRLIGRFRRKRSR